MSHSLQGFHSDPHLRIALMVLRPREEAVHASATPSCRAVSLDWFLKVGMERCHLETLRNHRLIELHGSGYRLTPEGVALTRSTALAGWFSARRPSWNAETGELRFDALVLGTVHTTARSQRAILDAFERAGWPACVENPLGDPSKKAPRRLREAVRWLRNRLDSPLVDLVVQGSKVAWRLNIPQ